MRRDVKAVERYQNLRHIFEGLLKLYAVLEVPLSFTIFEGPKGAIVISNSVMAGLDMHEIGRFVVNANRRPNRLRLLPIQCQSSLPLLLL